MFFALRLGLRSHGNIASGGTGGQAWALRKYLCRWKSAWHRWRAAPFIFPTPGQASLSVAAGAGKLVAGFWVSLAPCGSCFPTSCKAPDARTLDAQLWLARLGRQPPAEGAAQRLTIARAAVEAPAHLARAQRVGVTALTVYRLKKKGKV